MVLNLSTDFVQLLRQPLVDMILAQGKICLDLIR
jgi:hypothetical protein